MVRKVIRMARFAAFGLSLTAASIAGAQQTSGGPTPENRSWTMPATRDALGQKSAAFLSGGTGQFVSREAMRANGEPVHSAEAANSTSANMQPDLASQFNYVFGGVPGPETTLEGGQKLFTACEPHNCVGRRAFLVTDATGNNVQSAGFLNVECSVAGDMKNDKHLPSSCDRVPALTIFYSDKAARQPKLSLEIIKWARAEVAASKQSDRIKVSEKFLH